MRDELEKFVLQNRDQFDMHEPDPAIWERIKEPNGKTRFINWRGIIWKAAVVLLIFTSAFVFSEYLHRNDSTRISQQQKNKQIPELAEAEAYYSAKIDERLDKLQVHLQNHPEIQNELNKDLNELDQIYKGLRNDLKDNMNNEEVVQAMIQQYRMKLEILEDILRELQKTKNQPDENKEYDI